MNPDGDSGVKGLVKLVQKNDGACRISAHIIGLTPGEHGFHIHQYGNLTEGCKTAGPHFNPDGNTHGGPTDDQANRHVGDLGNVVAGEDGVAMYEIGAGSPNGTSALACAHIDFKYHAYMFCNLVRYAKCKCLCLVRMSRPHSAKK